MAMDQERLNEERHLQSLLEQLRRSVEALEKVVTQQKEEVISYRQSFWSDISINADNWDDLLESFVDITQKSRTIAEHEREFNHASQNLKQMKKLLYSPYFGRVEFKENGQSQAESIYIGTSSYRDEESLEFLVYDWRAPISSLYYDYPPGPAKYDTPMGEIAGEIELKRQYIIRNGKLLSLFDAGVTIGDEILQEILGQSTNTQMKSIVASIQQEQNQIIRGRDKKMVIVQGAAGSGKTSVALQRIAYLLYTFRHRITSRNMVLFSPNPLFTHYISNVLPELGEENIQQSTLHEYVEARLSGYVELEHPYTHLEALLTEEDSTKSEVRRAGIDYKGSIHFYQQIEEYAVWLNREGMMFYPLVFQDRILLSVEEIYTTFYSFDARRLSIRVELLKEWLLKSLKRMEKAEVKHEWVRNQLEELDKEAYQQAYRMLSKKKKDKDSFFDDQLNEEQLLRKMVVRDAFAPLYKWVKQLQFIDLVGIYKQLFSDDFDLSREHQATLPPHFSRICKDTLERIEKGSIPYEDSSPLLLLKELIEGFHRYLQIYYVVIDEAQDYTPFQLRLIAKMFPRSKWTILGDLNQAIWGHHSTLSELPFEAQIEEEEIQVCRLTKSYRSTKEIVQFTKSILADDYGIEGFERHGECPIVTIVENEQELHARILHTIQALKEKGLRTIAVICKTEQESMYVYQHLHSHIELQLLKRNAETYGDGVIVISSYLAKGLEFDGVILYNGSISNYGREQDRNLLYTICTRALHDLQIFAINQLSPWIAQADSTTFMLEK